MPSSMEAVTPCTDTSVSARLSEPCIAYIRGYEPFGQESFHSQGLGVSGVAVTMPYAALCFCKLNVYLLLWSAPTHFASLK